MSTEPYNVIDGHIQSDHIGRSISVRYASISKSMMKLRIRRTTRSSTWSTKLLVAMSEFYITAPRGPCVPRPHSQKEGRDGVWEQDYRELARMRIGKMCVLGACSRCQVCRLGVPKCRSVCLGTELWGLGYCPASFLSQIHVACSNFGCSYRLGNWPG